MFPDIVRDDVLRLETRRLWLRWPQIADAAALQALRPYATDDARSFIEASRAGNACGAHLRLALTFKSGARELIGMIGIEDEGQPQLCYWLGEAFCGQGLASEAVTAMTDAFFQLTTAEKLRAVTPVENAASIEVLQKAGFGRKKAEQSPNVLFAMNRAAWRSKAVHAA